MCMTVFFCHEFIFFNQDIFNAKTIFLSELKTELETIIKKRDLKVGGVAASLNFKTLFEARHRRDLL